MYIPKKIRKDPSERTICPVCKGEKFVKVAEAGKPEKTIPCPRCGGKGFI
jgi:DnaJ-class molecular chaperone